MRHITDFLGEAAKNFGSELAGNSGGGGGFDGPPLATTRQYRVKVARAEWRQATGSGKWSYSITYEVIQDDKDDEFVGRKFSEYYNIDDSAHEASKQAFSRFLGDSGVDLNDLDFTPTGDVEKDNNAFIKNFEGVQFVVATRVWGEEMDNTGIRYLNRDRGQALSQKVEPPKKNGASKKDLKPDIQVNKNRGPFDATPPEEGAEEETQQQAAPPVNLPGTGTRPPVNLPPGLRG